MIKCNSNNKDIEHQLYSYRNDDKIYPIKSKGQNVKKNHKNVKTSMACFLGVKMKREIIRCLVIVISNEQ